MPIKKGNTSIGAIYKGTTQIAKVYKGTKLLFENAVWLDYYFSNLYHSLVPETIDSKSVKNKAKVSVIEANGVVENQLVQNGNFADGTAGWYNEGGVSSSVNNGIMTITTTTAGNGIYCFGLNYINTHKYLVVASIKTSDSNITTIRVGRGTAGVQLVVTSPTSSFSVYSGIFTCSVDSTTYYIFSNQVGTFDVKNCQLIDLTLMFGTGNEPTAITDNRIQALLNRGYIPYNTGAYKGTDIGLFSSEAYNLLDLNRTAGNTTGWGWDNTEKRQFEEGKYYAGLTANNYFVSTSTSVVSIGANSIVINSTAGGYGVGLPIRVLGGETYRIEFSSNDVTTPGYRIGWYDKDGALISFNNDTTNKVAPQNAYWGVIVLSPSTANTNIEFSNICLHRTGTRTGYAPYQSFTPIAFKYQGNGAINAHDTMTITKDNVVFVKNVGSVDIGTLNWYKTTVGETSHYAFYTTDLSGRFVFDSSRKDYFICSKYTNVTPDEMNGLLWEGIAMWAAGQVRIFDTTKENYTDAQFKSSLSGVPLYYELATPQTITIPRKHLGVVDLGTLEWNYDDVSGRFYTRTLQFVGAQNSGEKANAYCNKFINDSQNNLNSLTNDNSIALCSDNNLIKAYISSAGTSATDFKASVSGTYLYYETIDEVPDIVDEFDIEAGGTVNANWFSWVENQIVYDGNFANGTNEWYCQGTIYSQSASNNIMTVTKNASGAGSVCSKSNSDITYDGTYKLLALAQIKPSRNCTMNFVVTDTQTGQSMTANVWNTLSYFVSPGSPHSLYFGIYETSNTLQVNDTVDIKNVMLIDLTQAFGSGNEPTSVNDPRIQYIINQGYIPTNTTGTYKLVDCEVLPNVEFKVKCK